MNKIAGVSYYFSIMNLETYEWNFQMKWLTSRMDFVKEKDLAVYFLTAEPSLPPLAVYFL